jgi:2-dehydro-3-deoxygluconokinase
LISSSATDSPEIVTLGETLVSLTNPAVGPLRYARTLDIIVGGAESNLAIGAIRLGRTAAWIGRVGGDEFGFLVQQRLRGEGLDVRVTVDPQRPTAVMVKSRRTADYGTVTYYRAGSAGSALCPDDVDEDLVSSARVLHITGITAGLSSHARDAVHAATEIARAHGVLVSVDFNYRRALWGPEQAAEEFRWLAKNADICFATADEAAIAVDEADPKTLARRLAELGTRHVLVKLGPEGAVGVVDDELHTVTPPRVTVIDPVGAGDAFAAGYLAGLLEGADAAERMSLAAQVGAYAVTVDGDWEGLPTRAELTRVASGTILR